MTSRLSALILFNLLAAGTTAAEPSVPNVQLDQTAVEVLKDLHNRGADLYNAADAVGALRMYEGALRTVTPFLAHRPKVQKTIEDGLADAFKLEGAKAQAFRLHEVIDQVRTDLKAAIKADAEAKPPTPTDPPKPEPKPEPKVGALAGTLTLAGKPVAEGAITLVSLSLAIPRVFTATVADGKFAFPAELPPATYAVMVSGAGIPDKFGSTMTAGLEVEVKGGEQVWDAELEPK